MEDLKKLIRELEAENRDSREVLNDLLEKLGESLLSRLAADDIQNLSLPAAAGDNPFVLLDEKLRLKKEISSSTETMEAIEADISLLKSKVEEIDQKEKEKTRKIMELEPVYLELGRLILEDSEYDQFSAPYRKQLDDIYVQIDFQEKRLEELENSEGNFVIRLANNARGAFTKSLLAKNEAAQEGIYRSAGEVFVLPPETPIMEVAASKEDALNEGFSLGSLAARKIYAQVKKREEIRREINSMENKIQDLNAEHFRIECTLGQGAGNPLRRISALKKYIGDIQKEISAVCLRFGIYTREKDRKKIFSSLYINEEKILAEKIGSLEESIDELGNRIKSIKITIAIEKEKADIEKIKKAIRNQQQRIAEAEADISEMELRVDTAEKRITELSGLL